MRREAYSDAVRMIFKFVKHGDDQLTEPSLKVGMKVNVRLVKEKYVDSCSIDCIEKIENLGSQSDSF